MPDPTPAGRNHTPTSRGDELLFAPWRLAYIESLSEDEPASAEQAKATPPPAAEGDADACFLSDYWNAPQDDERNHVIVRAREGMILLNRYPYAGGHLLVALGEPRPRLLDYDPAQRRALWTLVDAACELMEFALRPQGVNIGINQGRAAGAGIPQHLHAHLVPRWGGDVNFMTTVGRVRVIPSSLEAMAERYRAGWARLAERWGELLGT